MDRKLVVLGAAVCLIASGSFVGSAVAADGHWRQLSTTGTPPAARKHFVMVYDATGDRVVLYGGEKHVGGVDVLCDDVWQLSLGTTPAWTQLSPSNDSTYGNPGGRHGHSGAYVAGSPGKLLTVGGRNGFDETTPIEDFEASSWALTLSSPPQWTRLAAGFPSTTVNACPPHDTGAYRNRSHAAGAYLDGGFFMFGGWEVYKFGMQDMWRHSTTPGNGWSHRSGITSLGDACDDHPDRRYNHTLTTDNSYGRMIVFGGLYEESNISNAWFTEDGISWTCLGQAAAGSPGYTRNFHTSVHDPVRERLVVLGGYDYENAITGAVTALPLPEELEEVSINSTNTDWTTLTITGSGPGEIAEHCAVYDSQQDRMIVFGGVDEYGDLQGTDVWALEFDETAPSAVTITGGKGKNTAAIAWTAPGDDADTGTALSYDLRRSTSTITSGNFTSATQVTTGTPQPAGSPECVEVSGLTQCTTYYWALRTTDDAGNVSPISNVISMTQNCNGGQVLCMEGEEINDMPVESSELSFGLGEFAPGAGAVALSLSIPSTLSGAGLRLQVFDVAGRLVRSVASGDAVAGDHETQWTYTDEGGSRVPAGLYFARLSVGEQVKSVKIFVDPQN
jgi:hypothetical protein